MRASRRILVYEVVGFGALLLLLWADEIMDLPHMLLGSEATPTNMGEVALESGLVILFGATVVALTSHLLNRLRHLEGLMHVCGLCGKVRDHEGWVTMDDYIKRYTDAELRRTYCMDCLLRESGYKKTTPGE